MWKEIESQYACGVECVCSQKFDDVVILRGGYLAFADLADFPVDDLTADQKALFWVGFCFAYDKAIARCGTGGVDDFEEIQGRFDHYQGVYRFDLSSARAGRCSVPVIQKLHCIAVREI